MQVTPQSDFKRRSQNESSDFFEEVCFADFKATCFSLEEGFQGDFNESDEFDKSLLRISIYKKNFKNEFIFISSWCSQFEISTPRAEVQRFLNEILLEIENFECSKDKVISQKQFIDSLSWRT